MIRFKTGMCAVAMCGGLLWCLSGSGAAVVAPATPVHRADQPPLAARPVAALAAAETASVAATKEQQWGTLKGRFVFDGTPPEPMKLDINKDIEVCGKNMPVAESLVVNPAGGGIANIIVWLDVKKGEPAPPIHPMYRATAEAKVKLDNLDCRFEPHVCLLRTTQTLVVGNSDPVVHNAAFFLTRNDPANLIVPVKGAIEKRFPVPENIPCDVSCSIHAWMRARLLIKDHPYMAVTDKEGRFELPNVPAGERKFRIWHDLPGYVTGAQQAGRAVNWEKGIAAVTIQPGENDLGQFSLSAERFKP